MFASIRFLTYAANVKYEDLSSTTCYPSRVDSSASSLSNTLRGVGLQAVVGPSECVLVLNTSTNKHKISDVTISSNVTEFASVGFVL